MANNWVDRDNCMVYNVVAQSGPSKLDLAMALVNNTESLHRCPSEPVRVVFLTSLGADHVQAVRPRWFVRINDLGHEDGSGVSWHIQGYATRSARWNYGGANDELKIEGYYNSRSRTGQFFVENPAPSEADPNAQITINRRSDHLPS